MFLIINQRTTETNATILSKKGQFVASESQPVTTHIKQGGKEYDPLEIIYSVRSSIYKTLQQSGIDANKITSIGICSTPKVGVLWNKNGLPICNAPTADCMRSQDVCQKLEKEHIDSNIREHTGQTLGPNFPGPTIKKLSEQTEVAKALRQKDTCFGTLDSWILYHLTNGKSHKTDSTNAAMTLLLNIQKQEWDPFLLKEFKLNQCQMPTTHSNVYDYGKTENFLPLPDGIPITCLIQSEAAKSWGLTQHQFGQASLHIDRSGRLVVNTGTHLREPKPHMTSTIINHNGVAQFGLSTIIPFPKTVIRWLPSLSILSNPDEAAKINVHASSTEGVHIIPKYQHSGGHLHSTKDNITIAGINEKTTEEHIIRAYFESIVFQIKGAIQSLEDDEQIHIKELHITGKLSENDFLLQFMSDILQIPVIRMDISKADIIGTSILMNSVDTILTQKTLHQTLQKIDKTYLPNLDPISSLSRYNEWQDHK